MRKLKLVLLFCAIVMSVPSFANDGVDKFVGEWKLMVRDLPDGDAEMTLYINLKDGELSGKLTGADGEEFPLYDVEIEKKELNFMYDARGHNIPVNLELIGEGKCEGYMIDMFMIEGEKVKKVK